MHELAVCQALIDQVADIARSRQASGVTDVFVGIGPLSGVERPLMRNAFPIAAAGTIARDATLHIEATTVRVRCSECGEDSDVAANRLVCTRCGDWRTQLLNGDELILQRVVLEQTHV